jgi:type 1 glutamine amidotransferase
MTKRFSTVIVAMGLIGALAPDGSAGLQASLRASPGRPEGRHYTMGPQAPAPEPARGGRQGRRGGGDPFAGQPRIKALIVSGGCCHDYSGEAKVLMDTVGRALPVDWTLALQGGRGTTGSMPVYGSPDWAKGFDIVIHNECLANVTDPAYIRKITDAHRSGLPAMVIHCSMHSYRAATIDDWREFLGVTSRSHTAQHPISVKIVAKDHSSLKGFKQDWVTPADELYVIDKLWPNAKALATAVSPEDKKEYPLVWVNEYAGRSRVFGTTIGHGSATWDDPVFQDLLTRGFKWALKKE